MAHDQLEQTVDFYEKGVAHRAEEDPRKALTDKMQYTEIQQTLPRFLECELISSTLVLENNRKEGLWHSVSDGREMWKGGPEKDQSETPHK